MMLAVTRRRDEDRSRAITDRYNKRNLEIFREAMKNRGKPQEEIDRLSDELAEKQQPRRP